MSEFRVSSNKESTQRRDHGTRLVLWGAVLVLSCITLFAVYDAGSASPQIKTALAWLAGLIVAGAIGGAYFLSYRQAIEKVKEGLVFELTEKDLVRRRSGWPDVRIGLQEIHTLHEGQGWLVVESVEPIRKIAIPAEVEGFAVLRAELVKHSSVIIARRRSLSAIIPLVVSLICWVLVLWSKNARVAKLAAAVALTVLAWGSLGIIRLMNGKPKRFLVWIALGISWATAILLVYLRVMRGW